METIIVQVDNYNERDREFSSYFCDSLKPVNNFISREIIFINNIKGKKTTIMTFKNHGSMQKMELNGCQFFVSTIKMLIIEILHLFYFCCSVTTINFFATKHSAAKQKKNLYSMNTDQRKRYDMK